MKENAVALLCIPIFFLARVVPAQRTAVIADFSGGIYSNTADPGLEYDVTAGELKMSFPYAGRDANLVGYWRFESGASDETGNYNGGTLGPVVHTNAGKFNWAYYVPSDVSCKLINRDIAAINCATSLTVSFWLNKPGVGTHHIYEKTQATTNLFRCRTHSNGYMYFYAGKEMVMGAIRPPYTNSVVCGQWNHVVLRYDGSAVGNAGRWKVIVNGTNDPSLYFSGTIPASLPDLSGFNFYTWYVGGSVDEFKIYDRALSVSEIQAMFNEGCQYKAEGNWTSPVQAATREEYVESTTVYHLIPSNSCIDRLEWLLGNEVKAAYDTDITNGAVTEITESTLTFGSFRELKGDFRGKVYLSGDGSNTPVVTNITFRVCPIPKGTIVMLR